MAKTRLTTSPNSRAKAISHMGFVWETYFLFFLDPTTCGYRMWKHSQCCMAHLAQSALGTEYAMLLLLFDTPFPGLKKHYNWFGVIVLPIGFWMVSGFKRQQFHCGEPRVKEALVQRKLVRGVKTLVLSHHHLVLANDCSKIA